MINPDNYHLINEYLDYRKKIDRLDPKSIQLQQSVLKHLLNWCGDTPFSKAHKKHPQFVDYVLTLTKKNSNQPLSNNYRRKIITTARLFYQWMISFNKVQNIPPHWLASLKIRTRPHDGDNKSVSEQEIIQIANLPANSLIEKRIQAGACFLYISGMRISAFVTMPIQAVSIKNLEVHQTPALGIRTKNKKVATTSLITIEPVLQVVRRWDTLVRNILPPNGLWFAPLSPKTGQIDPTITQVGQHRDVIFRKNIRNWLLKNGMEYLNPHAFRRGHANFLWTRSNNYADLSAIKENLMHEQLVTTELYARQQRRQIKQRIFEMSQRSLQSTYEPSLEQRVSNLQRIVEQLSNQTGQSQ